MPGVDSPDWSSHVTIDAGDVSAVVSGVVSVSGGSINVAAGNVSAVIDNAVLSQTEVVYLGTQTENIASLAAGASVGVGLQSFLSKVPVEYDGLIVFLYTTAYPAKDYLFTYPFFYLRNDDTHIVGIGNVTVGGSPLVQYSVDLDGSLYDASVQYQFTGRFMGNCAGVSLKNNTTATIVNENVTVDYYGVITPTQYSPDIVQPASGSYNTINIFGKSAPVGTGTLVTYTKNVKKLFVNIVFGIAAAGPHGYGWGQANISFNGNGIDNIFANEAVTNAANIYQTIDREYDFGCGVPITTVGLSQNSNVIVINIVAILDNGTPDIVPAAVI